MVINEIETLLGVIESAFFRHTSGRGRLRSKQFFLNASKREGEMMIYRRRRTVVFMGQRSSLQWLVFHRSSQPPSRVYPLMDL